MVPSNTFSQAASNRLPPSNLTGPDYMLLLCIDDDGDDIEIFCDAVRAIDGSCNCVAASSGSMAMRLLESLKPDIIFLDINMPGMNGLETLKQIRKQKNLRNVPVVIYSTTNNPFEIMECLRHGATEFLRKPNCFEELCRSLKLLLAHNTNGSERSGT